MAFEYPLISENLLSDEFYLNSISMFLRGSWGMEDRCKMYASILQNLNECSQNLFDRLNIFYYKDENDNYFTKNKPDDMSLNAYKNAKSDYWLDMVGDILGLNRNVVVNIHYFEDQEDPEYRDIVLTNLEFLIYIEATIARNTFDGSTETLRKIYTGSSIYNADAYRKNTNLDSSVREYYESIIQPSFLQKLNIIYRTLNTEPDAQDTERLCCEIVVFGDENFVSDNLRYLFYNGFLTIESVGITYNREIKSDFIGAEYHEEAPDAIPPTKYEDDEALPYYVYQ